MKRINIILTAVFFCIGMTFLPAALWAEEPDSSGFGDDSFSSDEEGFGGFGDFEGFGNAAQSPLTVSGEFLFQTRYTVDDDAVGESPVQTFPELMLGLGYAGEYSDLRANLQLNRNNLAEDVRDVMDEAYIRLYYGRVNLEAGYMKVVWGNGDETHVLDVINPMDYSDFVNPDYIDRKEAETMVKLNVYPSETGLLELVYEPVFTPDTIPLTGRWRPAYMRSLETLGINPQNALVYPDTSTLDYGQTGVRYTTSLGGFDLGGLYYYGYLREPAADVSGILTTGLVNVSYDRMHLFGLEGAKVLAGFNNRAELGFYLTEDTGGDDPAVHNGRFVYLVGSDRDTGLGNLNVNVQVQGQVIVKKDGITPFDIEYDGDDEYTRTMLILGLTDSFRNEKIKPEIGFTTTLEKGDWFVRPKVDFGLRDDAVLSVNCTLFGGGSETTFGQYDNNDFVQVSFLYSF